MDEFENYNHYYIRVDVSGNIIHGYSDMFLTPEEGDICINEKGHGHFRLFPDGEDNPALFDGMNDIPLYRWTGSEVVRRTEEELDADRAAWAAEQARLAAMPTREDRIEAQVAYTAMLTDTMLQEEGEDV